MVYTHCRDDDDSDTVSTDEDQSWGGQGRFEYGLKGLPHALVHTPELVETGGHHAAFCTAAHEAAHKLYIKLAANFTRIYRSLNTTQDKMLDWVGRQILTEEVIKQNDESIRVANENEPGGSDVEPESRQNIDVPPERATKWKLLQALPYTDDWSCNLTKFISKTALLTREELVVCLQKKIEKDQTGTTIINDLQSITIDEVITKLHWECFGAATLQMGDSTRRKVVGMSNTSPGRRDFVRILGTCNEYNTHTRIHIRECVYIHKMACVYT
jgi:hypothetical protein